jgi:hypothetical protein
MIPAPVGGPDDNLAPLPLNFSTPEHGSISSKRHKDRDFMVQSLRIPDSKKTVGSSSKKDSIFYDTPVDSSRT